MTLLGRLKVALREDHLALGPQSVTNAMRELGNPERGDGALMPGDFGRDVHRHQLQIEVRFSHSPDIDMESLGPLSGHKIGTGEGNPGESVGVSVAEEMVF